MDLIPSISGDQTLTYCMFLLADLVILKADLALWGFIFHMKELYYYTEKKILVKKVCYLKENTQPLRCLVSEHNWWM